MAGLALSIASYDNYARLDKVIAEQEEELKAEAAAEADRWMAVVRTDGRAKAKAPQDAVVEGIKGLGQGALELGEMAAEYVVDTTKSTVKGMVRPVVMPLQTIGRSSRQASIHAVTKSLPGMVRAAAPKLRTALEAKLRAWADGREDVNALLPSDIASKCVVRVEIVNSTTKSGDGHQAAALFDEMTMNLKDISRAVKAVAASSSSHAGAALLAFDATAVVSARMRAGVVALHAVTRDSCGLPLVMVTPHSFDMLASVRVWWDTHSGMLRIAFVGAPAIDWRGPLRVAGGLCCCLTPQRLTDALISRAIGHSLQRFDQDRPLEVPLKVPVALNIIEAVEDHDDSLAALPGLVREACRALGHLSNPLNVDSIVPKAALKIAKGLVLMTHIRGGMAMIGGGVGSGILLKRMANGEWSPPVSIGTVGGSFGVQVGFRKTDTMIILPTDQQTDTFVRAADGLAQLKLGMTVAIAAGPIGRDASVDARLSTSGATVCLAYSHSQGAYFGYAIEGEILVGRQTDNEEYYYSAGVKASEIVSGMIDRPKDADATKLYQMLAEMSGEHHPHPSGSTKGGLAQTQPEALV